MLHDLWSYFRSDPELRFVFLCVAIPVGILVYGAIDILTRGV